MALPIPIANLSRRHNKIWKKKKKRKIQTSKIDIIRSRTKPISKAQSVRVCEKKKKEVKTRENAEFPVQSVQSHCFFSRYVEFEHCGMLRITANYR